MHSTTTPALKTTKKTTNISIVTTKFDTKNNRTRGGNEKRDQDEYGVKLILGSVVGIAMAIVLLIILAKSYTTKNPPSHKGTVLRVQRVRPFYKQEIKNAFIHDQWQAY